MFIKRETKNKLLFKRFGFNYTFTYEVSREANEQQATSQEIARWYLSNGKSCSLPGQLRTRFLK